MNSLPLLNIPSTSLSLSQQYLVEDFIVLGKEIDTHFHDTPQWEEKIFPHWYPHLYQHLPYEKLRFVDTDFLDRFETHLDNIVKEVQKDRT